jgi:hypothetical protein
MLNPTSLGYCAGAVVGAAVVIVGAFRRSTIDLVDVGLAGAVFIACTNIWPPIVLFFFAIDPTATATLPTRLLGYDSYLAIAAFLSFLISGIGIAAAFGQAWKIQR